MPMAASGTCSISPACPGPQPPPAQAVTCGAKCHFSKIPQVVRLALPALRIHVRSYLYLPPGCLKVCLCVEQKHCAKYVGNIFLRLLKLHWEIGWGALTKRQWACMFCGGERCIRYIRAISAYDFGPF